MLECGYTPGICRYLFRVDPDEYFAEGEAALAADRGRLLCSRTGAAALGGGGAAGQRTPRWIELNYLDDPHDVAVMIAVVRRALEIVEHGPATASER